MRSADELIRRYLDSIGAIDGPDYVGLFTTWADIVGQRIADHAQPVDIRGETVVIEADHPGWIQMVLMEKERIVRELRRRFPDLAITGISVRTAYHEQSGGSSTTTTAPAPAPTPAVSKDEKDALSRIEDPEMRKVLERLREEIE